MTSGRKRFWIGPHPSPTATDARCGAPHPSYDAMSCGRSPQHEGQHSFGVPRAAESPDTFANRMSRRSDFELGRMAGRDEIRAERNDLVLFDSMSFELIEGVHYTREGNKIKIIKLPDVKEVS